MKILSIALISMFSFAVMAQEDAATMKKDANEHLDQKIQRLQEAKSCVSATTTAEGVKACKYDLHEDMKLMKEKMKEEKMEEKDKDD